MGCARCWVACALAALASAGAPTVWAIAGDGLSVAPDSAVWSRWNSRVSYSAPAPSWRTPGEAARPAPLGGISVMADYFLSARPANLRANGFRATSGLLIGARSSLSLADSAAQAAALRGTAYERRLSSQLLPPLPGAEAAVDTVPVPYVGFGYTGLSNKGGWGFSADVGLMALKPSSAVKLGRVFGGTQNLDDMLRDLRLSPVLQLGVSYSF